MQRPTSHRSRSRRRGQALVEFALVLVPFLIVMMGILDLARAIYMMNGTAEAARDIARVTAVHPYASCCDLGSSADAQSVIAVQRKMIPGLQIAPSTNIVCVAIDDTVIPDADCKPGDFIRVTVTATFSPVTPLAKVFGNHTFGSVSRVQVP